MINPETLELINNARKFTYAEYRQMLDELQAQGLTTGPNQSPEIFEYARLNNQRMNRLDKTVVLLPELLDAIRDLNRPLRWVVITEGWCGDAAQNVPALAKIAEASQGKIEVILVLRDENLELIDRYLTNGGRSIPKMICFDAQTGEELGKWGPRPAEAQHLFLSLKNDPAITQEAFLQAVHQWYSQDKTQKVQQEMTALLLSWQL
jgi:hypothetical protein